MDLSVRDVSWDSAYRIIAVYTNGATNFVLIRSRPFSKDCSDNVNWPNPRKKSRDCLALSH